jgi:two-component system sensor histidine kinase KdpD
MVEASAVSPAALRRESGLAGIAASLLWVALATALIYPLREIAPVVSTGVVYMLAVLVVSTYWGLWLGLFTAVLSTLAFNFFHIPPTGNLDIANGENWVALGVFLTAAAIASSLAERSRAQAREAETEALRRSDETKTALLRAVSHDLRSPLTAIVAAGEALSSETIADGDRRVLAEAVGAEASRLSNLVDKLLDLSRLEAGHSPPRTDWCSIEEVVTAAVEALGERGDPVEIALDPDLPFVRADATQLERVFVNLLENAVRFRAGGQVTVSARARPDRVAVEVVDHGPGIPGEDLDRVFEPFYQRPGDRSHEGSGLGLAIVRGLVGVNGGRVWAESAPGRGASFVVELPLGAAAEPSERVPEEVG